MSIVKPLKASIYNVEKVLLKRAIFDPTQIYLEVDRGNLSEYSILNIYNTNAEPNDGNHDSEEAETPNCVYTKWLNNGKLININKPAFYLLDRVLTYPDGSVRSLSCVVGLINIHKQQLNLVERKNRNAINRRLTKTQQVGENIRALQVGYLNDSHLETEILAKVKTEIPHLCLSTGKDTKLQVSLWQIPDEYNDTISKFYKNIDLTVMQDTTNFYTMREYKDALRDAHGDHQDDTKTYDYSLAVITNIQHQAGALQMYIKAVHKKYIDLNKLNQELQKNFTKVDPENTTTDDKANFTLQINGEKVAYRLKHNDGVASDGVSSDGVSNDKTTDDGIVRNCYLYEELILNNCTLSPNFNTDTDIISIPHHSRLSTMLQNNSDDYVIFYPCKLSHEEEMRIIQGTHIYPHKTFFMDPPIFDGLLINDITPHTPKRPQS